MAITYPGRLLSSACATVVFCIWDGADVPVGDRRLLDLVGIVSVVPWIVSRCLRDGHGASSVVHYVFRVDVTAVSTVVLGIDAACRRTIVSVGGYRMRSMHPGHS